MIVLDESESLDNVQQAASNQAVNAKGGTKRRALQAVDTNQFQRQTRSKSGLVKASTESATSKRGVADATAAPQAVSSKASCQIVAKDEERIAGASKIEAPSEQNVEKKPSDATAKLDANTTKDSAPEVSSDPTIPSSSDNTSSSEQPADHDIDAADRADELFAAEYAGEIYNYLKDNESRSMVNPAYMLRQTDINAKMRVILNDWLVEVHLKFKLRQETLYLCFQIIDRFLEKQLVARSRLQLVGVTGLMLASKYEEIYPPEVRDYVYICDNAYTREQILEMEKLMLSKLDFRLSLPTVWSFMRRFTKAAGHQNDETFFHIVSYVIDLCMIDLKMLKYSPSHMVATAVLAAIRIQGDTGGWTSCLEHHTGFTETALGACTQDVHGLMQQAPNEPRCKAVFKKYSHTKFDEVFPILSRAFSALKTESPCDWPDFVALLPFDHAFFGQTQNDSGRQQP